MSRAPHFDVAVSRKVGEKWHSTRVGAAWKNDNGAIAVKIDPGISIATLEGVNVMLWPAKQKEDRESSPGNASDFSDDTPF